MDTKSNALLPGDELRKALCLAAGGEDNIRHIKTVRAEPRASLATRVSSLVGNAPVYAWHTAKTDTITLTCNADRIVLPSDMSGAFRSLRFLETIEVGHLDASQTKDIRFLFDGCESLRSITGLDSLDLASVERAANATNGCDALGKTRGMTLSRLESELSELVSDVDSLAEYAYEQGLTFPMAKARGFLLRRR